MSNNNMSSSSPPTTTTTSKCQLRCNHCWEYIQDSSAYVTSCFHIFCVKDARNWFRTRHECPACKQALSPNDLAEVQITVPNVWNMLWGFDPTDIDRVATSARKMWVYQKKQEVSWLMHENREMQREIDHLKAKLIEKTNELESRKQSFEIEKQSVFDTLNQRKYELETKVNECEEWKRRADQYEKMCVKLRHSTTTPTRSSPADTYRSSAQRVSTPKNSSSYLPSAPSPRSVNSTMITSAHRKSFSNNYHHRLGGSTKATTATPMKSPLLPFPIGTSSSSLSTSTKSSVVGGGHVNTNTPNNNNNNNVMMRLVQRTPITRVFHLNNTRSPASFLRK